MQVFSDFSQTDTYCHGLRCLKSSKKQVTLVISYHGLTLMSPFVLSWWQLKAFFHGLTTYVTDCTCTKGAYLMTTKKSIAFATVCICTKLVQLSGKNERWHTLYFFRGLTLMSPFVLAPKVPAWWQLKASFEVFENQAVRALNGVAISRPDMPQPL